MSLLRQHKNFVSIQAENGFSLKYMNWLGHHEFGLNHKPFNFPNGTLPAADQYTIEYWLAQWINAYNHALENAPAGAVFLSYEDLCVNPNDTLARLMTFLNVPYSAAIGSAIAHGAAHTVEGVDDTMLATARDTYQRLQAVKF